MWLCLLKAWSSMTRDCGVTSVPYSTVQVQSMGWGCLWELFTAALLGYDVLLNCQSIIISWNPSKLLSWTIWANTVESLRVYTAVVWSHSVSPTDPCCLYVHVAWTAGTRSIPCWYIDVCVCVCVCVAGIITTGMVLFTCWHNLAWCSIHADIIWHGALYMLT